MKINLAVIFGGQSVEHDISIITGIQAIQNLDKDKYNILPIYITKNGEWLHGEKLADFEFYKKNSIKSKGVRKVSVLPNSNYLYKKWLFGFRKIKKIDAVLIALHGINGEDGSVPAVFELSGVPYTSCSHFSSAICCDKVSFKSYIKGANIATAKFFAVSFFEYEKNKDEVVNDIVENLGFPIIIKPSKLGSSIGISICRNKKELHAALKLSFSLGEQTLAEKFLEDITEVNCAVLGVYDNITVSELEEPLKESDYLSFENKYINKGGAGDMAHLKRKMPANITKKKYNEIVEISKKLFKMLNMKGVVRIDFIVTNVGEVLVNEVNTVPGSFAHYLFEPVGLDFESVLDKIISFAIYESAVSQQKIKTFESDVLKKIDLNIGVKK